MSKARSARKKVAVTDDTGATLGSVSVAITSPARSKATAIIAHGAGGTMDTPSIVDLQKRLAAEGVRMVRFNFLYAELGKRAPDRQPKLEAAWRSVADWVSKELAPKRLFLGGRSMGGRMASYIVASGYSCDGLIFLAYPFHPPGKPDKQRKEHLFDIRVPMLFVSGTRDSFATLSLFEPVVKKLGAKLHLISDADHGFRVPKRTGRTPSDVNDEVTRTLLQFIENPGG